MIKMVMEQYVKTEPNGDVIYYIAESRYDRFNLIYHRLDGPAIIKANGDEHWYLNGSYNRLDGGPTSEFADGTKYWMKNNILHREDGPAVIYADGSKEWYINGKLHREDGPAIEYFDRQSGSYRYEYYLKGKKPSKKELDKITQKQPAGFLEFLKVNHPKHLAQNTDAIRLPDDVTMAIFEKVTDRKVKMPSRSKTKESPKKKTAERYMCPCGSDILLSGKAKHEITRKHQNYLNNN